MLRGVISDALFKHRYINPENVIEDDIIGNSTWEFDEDHVRWIADNYTGQELLDDFKKAVVDGVECYKLLEYPDITIHLIATPNIEWDFHDLWEDLLIEAGREADYSMS